MRITDVRSRLLAVSAPADADPAGGRPATWEHTLTTVSTDESIDGQSMMWGLNREGRGIATLARDVCRDRLIGADPTAIEARWQDLRDHSRTAYPLSDSLVALLDVAFWDITGKVAQQPIARLLGLYRDKMPAYASASSVPSLTVEGTSGEATAARAAGFHGYKVWAMTGAATDIARLRAARSAVGPDYRSWPTREVYTATRTLSPSARSSTS